MKPKWIKDQAAQYKGLATRWRISTDKHWIEITAPGIFNEAWMLHTSFPCPWFRRLSAETLSDAKKEAIRVIREKVLEMVHEIDSISSTT